MKKLVLILASLIMAIMLASTAQAVPYAVDFDADGNGGTVGWTGGTAFGYETTYGFSLTENTLAEVHQRLGADGILNNNDRFYETWTISLDKPLDNNYISFETNSGGFPIISPPPPACTTNPPPCAYSGFGLQVDVRIEGSINNYFNNGTSAIGGPNQLDVDTTATTPYALFGEPGPGNVPPVTYADSFVANYDGGDAVVYLDCLTCAAATIGKFGAEDLWLADLSYHDSSPLVLLPSLWENAGNDTAAAKFDVSYKFDSYEAAAFKTAAGFADFDELVTNGLMFAVNFGSTYLKEYKESLLNQDLPTWSQYYDAQNPASENEIVLLFGDGGSKIQLDAVPEPASMLLLGTGLVGLAGASRRRKKAAKKA